MYVNHGHIHHIRLAPPAPHFHPSISSAIKNTAVGALSGVSQAIQTQGRSPISDDGQMRPPPTTLTNSRDNTCHLQLSHLHLCDRCTLSALCGAAICCRRQNFPVLSVKVKTQRAWDWFYAEQQHPDCWGGSGSWYTNFGLVQILLN